MSMKTKLALAAFVALVLPTASFAQVGIGVRAGTLGIGGEAAIALGSHLAVRGGIGTTKLSYDGTFDNKTWHVDTPPSIWTAGIDLFPGGGGFHLSGGLLNRKGFDFAYSQTGSQTVGNTTYNGTVNIAGDMTNEHETAPYVGLGFGRVAKTGFGFSLDLGAAQMGDAHIAITSKSCTTTAPGGCPSSFNNDVETERQKVEDDIGGFLKWHPILSIGLHIGFGGK
jgi:hypothetical protein